MNNSSIQKPEELNSNVVELLLQRLQKEYDHHYFYQAASNWCFGVGYKKAGEYFLAESNEELEHARGLENYLIDWNIIPTLPIIGRPTLEFSDLAEVIEKAYDNEYEAYEAYEDVSVSIFDLRELCTFDFLKDYRKFQKDAVKTYSDMLNVLDGVNRDSKFEMLVLQEQLF